jgi:hypothetical protein
MTPFRRLDDALRDLLQLAGAELLLRLVVLLAPAVFLAAVLAAGSVPVWAVVVGLLLALLTVLAPDSDAGTLTTLYLLAVWYFGHQGDPYTLWTLVAALALLEFHVATTAATRAPHTGRLPAGSLARWSVRTAVVAGVTIAVYAVGRAFAALDTAGSAVLTTTAGVVAAAALVAARRWSLRPPGGPRRL